MSGWFEFGKAEMARGNIDWVNDDIRVACVESGYTPNYTTHQDRADLTNVVVLSAASLASKTVSDNGELDAADHTISSVTGNAIARLVFYKHTGTAATDTLILCIDAGTGFPFTPNGGDLQMQWQATTPFIGKL